MGGDTEEMEVLNMESTKTLTEADIEARKVAKKAEKAKRVCFCPPHQHVVACSRLSFSIVITDTVSSYYRYITNFTY